MKSVIITGRDLAIEHRPDRANPKRRRPAEYVAPPPSDVDVLALIDDLARTNPYWTPEANEWAEAHPEVRPVDAARKWRKHRIETA